MRNLRFCFMKERERALRRVEFHEIIVEVGVKPVAPRIDLENESGIDSFDPVEYNHLLRTRDLMRQNSRADL